MVQDYDVKRAGPRYDVVFEDTGLGDDAVNTLDVDALPGQVFALIENS